MTQRARLLAIAQVLLTGSVLAQPLALPAPPRATLVQRIDAPLPMTMPVIDADGRAARLGDYFAPGQPVLLVLGYYRCPQLCGLLMQGLLEALQASALSRQDARIVALSIDPDDTPATARARREIDLAYARSLRGSQLPQLDLLIAAPRDVSSLTQQIGYGHVPLPADESASAPAAYAHPAAVIVATPQGRVSRYLLGVRFEPDELHLALAEAARGRIGALSERIALLCAHVDLRVGAHNAAVIHTTRAIGLLGAAALAAWCWRRRAGESGARR